VTGTGVLLLHGSSGAPDLDRACLLEAEGYDVLAPRWFDETISEIPLESFPVAELAERNDRVAVVGVSRGAEAALLLGAYDDRVDAVVGLSPTAYMWAWIADGHQSSAWTWRGEALPFVPFDLDWQPADDPPSYVGLYRQSLMKAADRAEAARIPVERFAGDLLLAAGEDDRVWPSAEFARRIAAVRPERTEVLISTPAGHRPVFPGEQPKSGGQVMARGGSDEADQALGRLVWPHLLHTLEG